MKCVVTGATGFTGEHVVRRLVGLGYQPTVLVRTNSNRSVLSGLSVQFAEGNLEDIESMTQCFRGHDTLINVASIGFGHAPAIVAAAEQAGISRAVFTSTTAILTNLPVRSKPIREAAEQVVTSSRLQWTIVRPTMIYGTPRDRNICRLLRFIRRWRIVPLPAGGRALQQPVHVLDVASALVAACMTDNTIGKKYNISGKDPLSLRELVAQARLALGVGGFAVGVPISPVIAGLRLLEKIHLPIPIRSEQLQRLHEDKAFSHADAARDFGFQPRSFADGVRAEIELMGLSP